MCGRKLSLFLSAFLLVSAVSCFSLSPAEIERLQVKTREALIQIIIAYDEAMNHLESTTAEREQELETKESDLNEREAEQQQTEKLLIQQGELLVISSQIHRQTLIQNRIIFFLIGFGSGYLTNQLIP
jgi:putative aminopeptidase FrvX